MEICFSEIGMDSKSFLRVLREAQPVILTTEDIEKNLGTEKAQEEFYQKLNIPKLNEFPLGHAGMKKHLKRCISGMWLTK